MNECALRKQRFSRKLSLSLAGIAALAMPIVFGLVNVNQASAQAAAPSAARDIVGTWQGTLHAGQDLRTVIKVTKADGGSYKADFYSIDQPVPAMPSDSVKVSGSSLKITIPAVNGAYEGNVSADGNTLTGTWTQGGAPMPLPLILVRATPTTAWTIPEPPPPPKMMDTKARPEFEVATIKPSDPNRPGQGIGINRSGILNTLNTSLADLIKFAYAVHPRQIVGAPAWVESEKFDLTAKPDTPGLPSLDQAKAMMQKLLADRFSLTFHKEKKELSAYVITVAKGGEKIKKADTAALPVPAFGGPPQRGFNVRTATMAEFAQVMQSQFMEQPVVDQTGLGDTRYSFILKWTPDPSQNSGLGGGPPPPTPQAPVPDADAPPDLFAALQQQLGLQMKMAKTQVDVMVIDKVQKPSEN